MAHHDGRTDLQTINLTLLAGVVLCGALFVLAVTEWFGYSAQPAQPRAVTARGDLAEDEKNAIEIFENASPSVVFITTKQQVRDFWSRNIFTVPKGAGSGFIWDEQGHVVTNFHVIEGASEAIVQLNDGRSLKAGLVGVSPAHDLAVLRIFVAFDKPPPVPIGTSGDLKVGQKVFAIGNPFGLDYTLTSGLVSALDRTLGEGRGRIIKHLIQTDAAINPGNSGGPLLDSAGRLIGINTAIYSPSGAYAGIGFAVPVDTVNKVVPELISKGQYVRPTLGISVDNRLNQLITERLGVKGVVVLDVEPGSAAEQAGLVGVTQTGFGGVDVGDIIIAINGQPIESISDLLDFLEEHRVGDQVRLTLLRDNTQVSVDLVLQAP